MCGMKKRAAALACILMMLLGTMACAYGEEATGGQATCTHHYENGKCTACSEVCAHPGYSDGKCTVCGQAQPCEHEWADGKCTKCQKECLHEWSDGVCKVCRQTQPCEHNWANGKCTKCQKECLHDWKDGKCATCGQTQPCEHNWANGECTKCQKECLHDWSGGECTKCHQACTHSYTNGVCETCGQKQPCAHDKKTESKWDENIRYVAGDSAATHTRLADQYSKVVCEDCNAVLAERELAATDVSTAEDHDWQGGKCAKCGYVCPHTVHDQSKKCAACGETCKHSYDQAHQCTVCGYECTHPNPQSGYLEKNRREYRPSGENMHSYVFDLYTWYTCAECQAHWEEDEPRETGVSRSESCIFSEQGICIRCHAQKVTCPHEHTYEVMEPDFSKCKTISSNDVFHTYVTDIVAYDYCTDCHRHVNKRVVEEDAEFTERHEDMFLCTEIGNVCEMCGYTKYCDHRNTEKGGWPDIIKKVLSTDRRGHTVLCNAYMYVSCTDCGYTLDEQAVYDTELWMEHNFEDGDTCEVCGAPKDCAHEAASTSVYDMNVRSVAIVDENLHSYVIDRYEEWYCPDCGEYSGQKLIGGRLTIQEPHKYDGNGLCSFCGAVKPKPTPAPAEEESYFVPTPRPAGNRTARAATTPAPTAAATAVPVPVPTVEPTPAPQKKEMVSTLLDVFASAETEGVTVEIVGAQEVLTQEEYTELRTLSSQEQVLVTLQSIGLTDVVQAAMSTMNVQLSSEADSLMDKVGVRMEQMTSDERQSLEKKLSEQFRVTERVVDGVTVKYFSMDMKVVNNNGRTHVERYQFYLDEHGEWIFERVDPANFAVIK